MTVLNELRQGLKQLSKLQLIALVMFIWKRSSGRFHKVILNEVKKKMKRKSGKKSKKSKSRKRRSKTRKRKKSKRRKSKSKSKRKTKKKSKKQIRAMRLRNLVKARRARKRKA